MSTRISVGGHEPRDIDVGLSDAHARLLRPYYVRLPRLGVRQRSCAPSGRCSGRQSGHMVAYHFHAALIPTLTQFQLSRLT